MIYESKCRKGYIHTYQRVLIIGRVSVVQSRSVVGRPNRFGLSLMLLTKTLAIFTYSSASHLSVCASAAHSLRSSLPATSMTASSVSQSHTHWDAVPSCGWSQGHTLCLLHQGLRCAILCRQESARRGVVWCGGLGLCLEYEINKGVWTTLG